MPPSWATFVVGLPILLIEEFPTPARLQLVNQCVENAADGISGEPCDPVPQKVVDVVHVFVGQGVARIACLWELWVAIVGVRRGISIEHSLHVAWFWWLSMVTHGADGHVGS